MYDGIILDENYGVNPTMTTCFFCGEPKDILLIGKTTKKMKDSDMCSNDGEMNRNIGVMDMEPCNECAKLMEQGIMIISTRDGEVGGKNPYRTGKMVVVKEDFIERCTDEPLTSQILEKRCTFMEDSVWSAIGLPEEGESE